MQVQVCSCPSALSLNGGHKPRTHSTPAPISCCGRRLVSTPSLCAAAFNGSLSRSVACMGKERRKRGNACLATCHQQSHRHYRPFLWMPRLLPVIVHFAKAHIVSHLLCVCVLTCTAALLTPKPTPCGACPSVSLAGMWGLALSTLRSGLASNSTDRLSLTSGLNSTASWHNRNRHTRK